MPKYRVFGVQEQELLCNRRGRTDEYEAWDIINGDKVFQWFAIPYR
jgi:hypothetical protein